MVRSADDAPHSRSSGGQPPPPGDRELVLRALADVDAFAELYRRHVRDVHAYVARRSGSSTIADDVTAQAFERALRNLAAFRWRDGGFRAWVFRIAANELTDHYRREQSSRRRNERYAAVTAVETVIDLEARDDANENNARHDELRAALAVLRPRYQEAITLRHLAGLEAAEAAAAMRVSKATFAVTLHRAMRALERAMEHQP